MTKVRKTPLEKENERLRELVHEMHAKLSSVVEEMDIALRSFDAIVARIPEPEKRTEDDGA